MKCAVLWVVTVRVTSEDELLLLVVALLGGVGGGQQPQLLLLLLLLQPALLSEQPGPAGQHSTETVPRQETDNTRGLCVFT